MLLSVHRQIYKLYNDIHAVKISQDDNQNRFDLPTLDISTNWKKFEEIPYIWIGVCSAVQNFETDAPTKSPLVSLLTRVIWPITHVLIW